MAGKATNILFVNGSEDPWSTLSLTDPSALPPGIDVLVVRGGSHCEDLSNLDKGMLSGVFEAHLKFNQLARGWLGQYETLAIHADFGLRNAAPTLNHKVCAATFSSVSSERSSRAERPRHRSTRRPKPISRCATYP